MPTNTDKKAPPKGPTQGQLNATANAAAKSAAKARGKLVEDIERLCSDAGISLATLARESGVLYSHLWRIMAGKATPTIETYAKLAVPLGADLATRLYPNTGPRIRDRHQAPITEALLQQRHPRWRPATEVRVRHPSRGWIDVVLHDPRESRILAVEIESDIRRIEQQVRWARMKAESLPSWEGWPPDAEPAQISQLLIVRRTRVTRHVAAEFEQQLRVAYPAHPEDALAALTGTAAWPGSAMIWAQINPDGVRFLPTQ
jgi:transcriptional regulator with XRE-family HTH domain